MCVIVKRGCVNKIELDLPPYWCVDLFLADFPFSAVEQLEMRVSFKVSWKLNVIFAGSPGEAFWPLDSGSCSSSTLEGNTRVVSWLSQVLAVAQLWSDPMFVRHPLGEP